MLGNLSPGGGKATPGADTPYSTIPLSMGLQVLRRHQGTILSVMDTFVHDPLVEWVRAGAKKDADAGNPHAQDALATIKGGLRKGGCMGVEGRPMPGTVGLDGNHPVGCRTGSSGADPWRGSASHHACCTFTRS